MIKQRLIRKAVDEKTLRELIENAKRVDLEEAMIAALDDEVEVYFDPFDIVRNFPDVLDDLRDEFNGYDDFYDLANIWLEENDIDKDADCVFYVDGEEEYTCCMKDELVDVVLKMCSTDKQRDTLFTELLQSTLGTN